jgi:hypothetical protein
MEAVAGTSHAELEIALHRLIGAGLLFQQGVPPHAHYLFRRHNSIGTTRALKLRCSITAALA